MYKNGEGYPDPTAGRAMGQVIREYKRQRREEKERIEGIKNRRKIYVVSKYAGDVKENIKKARRYCRFVTEQKCIPIASHLLYTQFLNDEDPAERELGLLFGQALLARCNEIWVFGTEHSDGMKAEIHEAKKLQKKIRYFNERMEPIYENA